MVSEFIHRNKSVDENTTIEDEDEPTNGENAAVSNNPVPEDADADNAIESPENDLHEIEEFLYENQDLGKVRPLKKRPRMMEIPYSTGV